ncbi:MAG: Hydrolase of X-linked nucleoside diphosphate terminal [Firmicutes bacterium]|jgi:hypothetical protein|nr:Hydrolase of X-linked nucleoside diphosphate terminal [Bacillota bacterium]
MEPKWLNWAKQLQSLAQAGLTYSRDKIRAPFWKKIIGMESYEESG